MDLKRRRRQFDSKLRFQVHHCRLRIERPWVEILRSWAMPSRRSGQTLAWRPIAHCEASPPSKLRKRCHWIPPRIGRFRSRAKPDPSGRTPGVSRSHSADARPLRRPPRATFLEPSSRSSRLSSSRRGANPSFPGLRGRDARTRRTPLVRKAARRPTRAKSTTSPQVNWGARESPDRREPARMRGTNATASGNGAVANGTRYYSI